MLRGIKNEVMSVLSVPCYVEVWVWNDRAEMHLQRRKAREGGREGGGKRERERERGRRGQREAGLVAWIDPEQPWKR